MSAGRESIDLLALALAHHRAPLDLRERLTEIAILPEDMGRLLWLANGSAEPLAAAAHQTGADSGKVRAAALFLLQRLCFARDASHYRVLGLNPDATAEKIREHHRLLMRLVHPDRAGAADFWVDSYAARINEAYSVLSRPQTRAAYDALLARQESVAAMVPVVARPRSSTWREAPRRRRLLLAPRAHLPALVLGGLALVAACGVAGIYLLGKPSMTATAESGATVADIAPVAALTIDGAVAASQAKLDRRTLERIEREANTESSRILADRDPLESARQEQLRSEQAELERLQRERILLEQQLRATRLELEQWRSEPLLAGQTQAERSQSEQPNAERLQREQEQLRAEQARFEKLIEQARAEQLKLERLRAEQLRAGKLAEKARKEQARIPRSVESVPRQPLRPSPPSTAGQAPLESPTPGEREVIARDLTARELDHLVDRYTSAYQSGDLGRLMTLFDARARGGGKDRNRLRRDYADFFDATQSRRLTLTQMRWDPRGTVASGVARYQLRAVRTDGVTRDYEGRIRFEVSRQEDARVLIRSIDFDIRPLQ